MSGEDNGLPQAGWTMEMSLRPVVPVQRSGVLFSLCGLAKPHQPSDAVNVTITKPSLSQREIEILRVSFVQYGAHIWDNVASFARQYTYYTAVSARSLRVFFATEVLKASAPSWKCEVFANEGTILEDEWERGHFEDHRAIFTTAQYRTIKERLETEIEKCWFEVASEMSIFTEREFEIGEVKALYELHHGGKSGAEAGIVNGLARLEV